MKILLVIFLVLSSSIILSKNDSTIVKIYYDTSKVKQNDSTIVKIDNLPETNWLSRNEGAIIGTFLASLFAILTVYLTHKSNRKLRIEKEKQIYYGLLFSLRIEFNSQIINLDSLIQELFVIK